MRYLSIEETVLSVSQSLIKISCFFFNSSLREQDQFEQEYLLSADCGYPSNSCKGC